MREGCTVAMLRGLLRCGERKVNCEEDVVRGCREKRGNQFRS
jgi:hypothetical protein